MKKLLLGLAAVASLAATLPAAAQTIDAREHQQDRRIEQGVHSGALTPAETARLRLREARLRAFEARARLSHEGYLSHHARTRLRHMEHRDSHLIHRLKHNDHVG